MLKKKELKEEELEKVSGGSKTLQAAGNIDKYSDYNVRVNKYSGQIGTKYLFVKHNSDNWLFGTLVSSYERHEFLFATVRTHDIKVEDGFGDYNNKDKHKISLSDYGTREINGDEYQMYAKS